MSRTRSLSIITNSKQQDECILADRSNSSLMIMVLFTFLVYFFGRKGQGAWLYRRLNVLW